MNWNVPGHLLSEAVVQAEFYAAAKYIGLRCTLELSTREGRLDVAVFNDDWTKLLAIVECKNKPFGKVNRTRQIERYKKLGVPVYGLSKVGRAMPLAQTIKKCNHAGIAVTEIPRNRTAKARMTDANRVLSELDEDLNFHC